MDNECVHLFCFPLNTTKLIQTISGMKLFQLIWLKCCFNHTFSKITVTKKDRNNNNLSRIGYERGLKELEEIKLISIDKAVGKCSLISINEDLVSEKAKEFILKNQRKREK
jgi:hypothetical protein